MENEKPSIETLFLQMLLLEQTRASVELAHARVRETEEIARYRLLESVVPPLVKYAESLMNPPPFEVGSDET